MVLSTIKNLLLFSYVVKNIKIYWENDLLYFKIPPLKYYFYTVIIFLKNKYGIVLIYFLINLSNFKILPRYYNIFF